MALEAWSFEMSGREPLRFTPAFRRRKLPTEADLERIPTSRAAQFQLSDEETRVARRFIYQQNRDWMRTGIRYRTMREHPYLYVLKLD
jgi:hypothetical protein